MDSNKDSRNVINYIPHRGKMLLIDKVINREREQFAVEVNMTAKSSFASHKGVPTYCVLEYMAQSIAAYNTLHFSEDKRSKIGFIISVRNLKNQLEFFPLNEKLIIKVRPVLIVSSSGTFNCMAYINEKKVSSARITAYVPTREELERFKSYGRTIKEKSFSHRCK